MTGEHIAIRIDGGRQRFLPGDTLSGTYRVAVRDPESVIAIELSVLWYTEGLGDEDLAVHYFERHSAEHEPDFDPSAARTFGTPLPNSPLSYDGIIVKVHWAVRARAFLREGKDLLVECPIHLGAVPTAVEVPPPPEPTETAAEAEKGGGF